MKATALTLFTALLLSLTGCFDRREAPIEGPDGSGAGAEDPDDLGPFQLKPEWSGPCQKVDGKVDVNLGNAPEVFIRAAHCQVNGTEPSKDLVSQWAGRLKKKDRVRRLDAVISICKTAGRKCEFAYSDPWLKSPDDLGPPPVKKVKRDLGAVLMFFFSCPDDTNCKMDWANTHSPGMWDKSPLLAFGETKEDHYSPLRAGFWRRELMDAKYAGLDFLIPNTYGPDIEDGKLKPLQDALDSLKDPVKIGFFDDTWTWGQPYFSEFWKTKPDLNDPEKAATLIYEHKWKAFFSQIDKKYWYRFKGKPFIYFYNAGSLMPRSKTGPVMKLLKEKFKADFGEEPFVDADGAYFEDPTMNDIADSKYMWFTFNTPEKRSRETMHGHIIDHAMVKWDATGRDHAGEPPRPSDLIIKDDRFLRKVLKESEDAELLVIATWNDLGEGTGFNRNYDYYFRGQWQRPDYFMRVTRKAQAGALKMKRALLVAPLGLLLLGACSGKGNSGKLEVEPTLVQQVPWINGRPAQHDDGGKAVVPTKFEALQYPRIATGTPDPGSRVFDPSETEPSDACDVLQDIELSSWHHDFEPTAAGFVGVAQFWSDYSDTTEGAWLIPGDAAWYPETALMRDPTVWGLASEKIDNDERALLGDAPLGLPNCGGAATPNLHALHIRGGRFNHFGGGLEHPLNLDCTLGQPPGHGGDICDADKLVNEMVDLSSYDGIAFWARRGPEGSGGLQLGIQTKDTSDYLARTGKLGPTSCDRIKACVPKCDNGAECVEVTQTTPLATRLRCVPPGADPNQTPEPSLLEALYPQCGADTCKGPPYFADPDFGPEGAPAAECKPYTFSGLEEGNWCFYDAPAAPGDRCGDGFVGNVSLSTDWTYYKMPFANFRQVGFAKRVDRFDLKNVFSIAFQFSVGWADFYVDNVSFYRNK